MTSVRETLDSHRLRILRKLKVERIAAHKTLLGMLRAGTLEDELDGDSTWRTLRAHAKVKAAEALIVEVDQAIERELNKEMEKLGHRPTDAWVASA